MTRQRHSTRIRRTPHARRSFRANPSSLTEVAAAKPPAEEEEKPKTMKEKLLGRRRAQDADAIAAGEVASE